jgi:hypothetical protein
MQIAYLQIFNFNYHNHFVQIWNFVNVQRYFLKLKNKMIYIKKQDESSHF